MKNNCTVGNCDPEIEEILGRIKGILGERGLDQGELAAALHKSEGWMSRILSGKIVLTLQTLQGIAKVLGVSPRSLIPEDAENKKQELEEWMREISRDEIAKDREARQKS